MGNLRGVCSLFFCLYLFFLYRGGLYFYLRECYGVKAVRGRGALFSSYLLGGAKGDLWFTFVIVKVGNSVNSSSVIRRRSTRSFTNFLGLGNGLIIYLTKRQAITQIVIARNGSNNIIRCNFLSRRSSVRNDFHGTSIQSAKDLSRFRVLIRRRGPYFFNVRVLRLKRRVIMSNREEARVQTVTCLIGNAALPRLANYGRNGHFHKSRAFMTNRFLSDRLTRDVRVIITIFRSIFRRVCYTLILETKACWCN